MNNKLVMVSGIQRSGTSVLYYTLLNGKTCCGYEEAIDSELFKDWNLKPESQIRECLQNSEKPVLIKMPNATADHRINQILEEFHAYTVYLVWIYRDPVNVCYSTLEHYRHRTDAKQAFYDSIARYPDPLAAIDGFIEQWRERNRQVIDALSLSAQNIFVVKYEDLVEDPGVVAALCRHLGIAFRYNFRPDSNAGYTYLPEDVCRKIARMTADVWCQLDECRHFTPDRNPMRRYLKRLRYEAPGHRIRLIRRMKRGLKRFAQSA
ncbi:MAG: hypothetical protein GF333_01295 [Candidatus Omnitrophica bacterium]|nr:hypothetical protein [Candidatus Omnitrophota bacterium]